MKLEFWYEFASTYSYPVAERIERDAKAAGVEVVWRPFLLGPIFAAQGWRDSPFNLYPVKGRYMWRDLARICEEQGIPLRRPGVFPRNGLVAARVALVGAREGWTAPFTRAVYRANFADDREISEPMVITEILEDLDLDAEEILSRAQQPEIKEQLKDQTAEAKKLGIFGAPSFTVGEELFWGGDRLRQALAWAKGKAP